MYTICRINNALKLINHCGDDIIDINKALNVETIIITDEPNNGRLGRLLIRQIRFTQINVKVEIRVFVINTTRWFSN